MRKTWFFFAPSSPARAAAGLASLLAVMSAAPGVARAEGYTLDANFGVGSGLEGGDPGRGLEWRRARLRVESGVDLRSDENEADAFGVRAFVEVEKRTGVGGEVRYERWLSHDFAVWGCLSGVVAPETLFGGGVGGTAVIPFGRRFGLFVEPTFQALPLGSDTPHDAVLVWALVNVGVRFSL